MGSVPSLYLCSNPFLPVKGLILHSAIASGLRIIDSRITETKGNDFFPNIEMIRFVRCPILMIHGVNDEIISIENAKSLLNCSQTLTMFWWAKECGHNDIMNRKGEEFFKIIRNFIKMLKKDSAKIAENHFYTFNKVYEEFYRGFLVSKGV